MNFPELLNELKASGVSWERIAAHCDVSISTVFGWRRGIDPRYSDGEKVIDLHAKTIVGKMVEKANAGNALDESSASA